MPNKLDHLDDKMIKELPKINIHEHLDCSLRPMTILELWDKVGFENAKTPFPPEIIEEWNTPGKAHSAAQKYQDWLSKFSGKSLTNYLQAINDHVIPLLQNKENLIRVTKEHVEDKVEEGIIGLELRFAPHLSTAAGLAPNEVLAAILIGIENAAIPIQLNLCVLRHQSIKEAEEVADLVINSDERVGTFDLAGDESKNPGVLNWWLHHAKRVQDAGKKATIHLWETNEPSEEDLKLLDKYGITRIGHGIKGSAQDERILEVSPSSNVHTGQVSSYDQHPVGRLYSEGKRVTINSDGTLFTKVDLVEEYKRMHKFFGWNKDDFLKANLNALEASNFSDEIKDQLREKLHEEYK